MIGAPPAQDEQARLSGARGDFVANLPRRLDVLRAALRAVEDEPRDGGRINGLLRRLHALGSAARVLGFASVAEALGEAEKTLRRASRGGPASSDLADIARALDLLPSLVLGARVSIRPPAAQELTSAPSRDFPLSVLVFGPEPLAEALMAQGDLRVECERTEEPGKARELSRAFGPDVAVIDADRKGARELVESFVKDPVAEPIPLVVVGDFASPELSSTFIALGATRVLPKPVSPDALRRTLLELRDQGSPQVHAREPLGELTVTELVDRIVVEVRRGLVEAVDPVARSSSVSFGEGTDVMGAVWGTVARLRELVTLRSDGNVRFEPTGPEGAVPLAPWNDDRRLGERGARENRSGDGVSLRGRRVVVADDDPAVVWFLSGILKTVGAEVFEAHDGERAFELTAALWPDLVVSDVLMPKLDGFSLCHEIKRDVAVRDVPVILLSWKEDLLQRVRELGGDADGYLRKEAAASTVVERLREVLRPRARVEQRVASGGEVRGRLDGLTPRLVLELACRTGNDARVSVRDSSYLYEIQVRAGAPRTAIRSAADGSFQRGEDVLAMLLGVSAGRFVIEPDQSPCRAELSGSLNEQLAGPVARARAAQRALSAGALASVTRVVFDAGRVAAYLDCTPEPARRLLRDLLDGASPRDLLTSGRAPARLLEAVLSDFSRRGAVLLVETAAGVEDISQTRVPPPASLTPAPPSVPPPPQARAPESPLQEPPPSQGHPAAIHSSPPDAELASADAGWFSFQIEGSAEPPKASDEPLPVEEPASPKPLARADDPLRKTLTSSAPPPTEDELAPGASVPVERGYRPEPRTDTLGSAGNEAAAALAAVSAAASVVEPTAPRSEAAAPRIDEDDPLAQALLESSPPVPVAPAPVVRITAPPPAAEPMNAVAAEPPVAAEPSRAPEPDAPLPAAPPIAQTPVIEAAAPRTESMLGQTLPLAPAPREPKLGQTLPLDHARPKSDPARPAAESTENDSKPSDASTQPPKVAVRAASAKTADKPAAAAPGEGGGSILTTVVLSLVAAGATYYGVTALSGRLNPAPAAAPAVSAAPVPVPVASAAAAARPPITLSESPLPRGTDVPAGSGLLEVQVPAGTGIRVDGEYLGMGPGRRVPLTPGPHRLQLGDADPVTVTVKAGQRTLAILATGAGEAPAQSP